MRVRDDHSAQRRPLLQQRVQGRSQPSEGRRSGNRFLGTVRRDPPPQTRTQAHAGVRLKPRGSEGASETAWDGAAMVLTDDAIERIAHAVAAAVGHALSGDAGASGSFSAEVTDDASALLTTTQIAIRLGRTPAWVRQHRTELGAIVLGSGPRPRLLFSPEVVTRALAPHPIAAERPVISASPAAWTAESGVDLGPHDRGDRS